MGSPVTKINCKLSDDPKSQVQKMRIHGVTQDDRALIVFTDGKDFTLEIVKNRQNDRVYGP